MKVEPFENWRFWVTSETRKGVRHLVDLMHEGRPCCSCEDFQIRLEPKFEVGIRVKAEDLCKHCLLCIKRVGKHAKELLWQSGDKHFCKQDDLIVGEFILNTCKINEQK